MQSEDTSQSNEDENPRSLWKLVASSSIIASMCCLPSVVLVMFGIATVSTGAALSDTLYWGEDGYSWFRPLMLLIASITVIVVCSVTAFLSITSWALLGKFLRKFATNNEFIKRFNYAMSILLVGCVASFYI